MRSIISASALGLMLTGFGFTRVAGADQQQVELEELKQQVAMLLARIEQLEQSASTAARNSHTPAAAPAATPPATPPVAPPEALAWARNVKWKGDFRYRHEQFDIEGTASDRVRHRIRARLGMEGRISDTLLAGFEIATADLLDPRSTNSTLDDSSARKAIGLNLAYVDWRPRDAMLVTIGKQQQPWFKAGNSLFFDGDINPEGIAFLYGGKNGAFARVWGYWLDENSVAADSNLIGAQLGYVFDGGLTLTAGYWDYGAIKNQPILVYVDSPAGNSSYAADADCAPSAAAATSCYTYDYNIAVVEAQWSGKVGAMPFMLFGGYLENMDPEDLNTGFDLGFLLGKAADPGSWEVGALYQDVERDAQFALFLDSDFAGGLTQGRGVQLQGAWAPARNMTVKATYYVNDRNYDTPSEVDYKRLQLDLHYKF